MSIRFRIDGKECETYSGASILQASLKAGIYIPHICFHPDLPSYNTCLPDATCYQGDNEFRSDKNNQGYSGCGLCLVEIRGQKNPVLSCETAVEEGMNIVTHSDSIQSLRRDNMALIFRGHPHAIPPLGESELHKVADYIGYKDTQGRDHSTALYIEDDKPLFIRDYNRCIGCLRCVRVCSDSVGAKALAYTDSKGTITVGTQQSTIEKSGCVFCGACVEVCPSGALRDKNIQTGDRKQALIPCVAACPLEMDVPTYVHFIAQGSFDEAVRTIREKTPMGLSLGYICQHPCEDVCRRGELSDPIAICHLKRLALETKDALMPEMVEKAPPSGKKVAIIGAGPAGLVAAYYLTIFGHDVTVFESQVEAGGMLRYAVPEYRLPLQIIKHEIRILKSLGVSFRLDTRVDVDFFRDELDQGQWNAVFLATGAQNSQKIDVEGLSFQGVYWGVDFLSETKEGWAPDVGEKTVIIGGGHVAVDSAMTALRLGAGEVVLACPEEKTNMPASSDAVEEMEREGIRLCAGWGIKKILGEDANVSGVELKKCASLFDKEGRFAPVFDEARTTTIQADSVILALGQVSEFDYLPPDCGIQIQDDYTLETKTADLETHKSGFFAGGQCRTGLVSAVDAMAEGRRAASAIDRFLGGQGFVESLEEVKFFDKGLLWRGRRDNFDSVGRIEMAELPIDERTGSFAVPRLGYCTGEAEAEAERCLKCHLRFLLTPAVLPPEK